MLRATPQRRWFAADSALKMLDTVIAQQPSAEAYRYQEYLGSDGDSLRHG